MSHCGKCGDVSYGYHYLVEGEFWCSRCLPLHVKSLTDRLAAAEAALKPDAMKTRVCEYLLSLNDAEKPAFIPWTAVDWIGNGIVKTVLAAKAGGGDE